MQSLLDIPQDTRRRLIHAAGEIFAEHGFHKATVRQITDHAKVNVAAINYHFRDKAELYASVLRECHCAARDMGGPLVPEGATPEERLHSFIAGFVGRLLHPARPHWHGILMAREMTEPSAALDLIVEESMRPQARILQEILVDMTGGRFPTERIMMLGFSVVSQCLFYLHDRPVIDRLFPKFRDNPPTNEQIVEHVYAFSLAAIQSIARTDV
jgi:AcrR family transcriptional regulator